MRDRHLDRPDGYPSEIGRFVAMLTDTRARLTSDLKDLDEDHLDAVLPWAPNAIGTLLYHVAAIELDWTFADLLETDEFPEGTGDWFPVDVREENGRLTPMSDPLQRHLERLEWVRGQLLASLRGLTDADLERTLNPDNPSGGGWILHHLMQHEAEHRGQIGEIRAALRS